MDQFRERVDKDPKAFLRAISFHSRDSPFRLVTDPYLRKLSSQHPESIDEWYQTKSFYLSTGRRAITGLYSPDLIDHLLQDYQLLVPLYHFLVGI